MKKIPMDLVYYIDISSACERLISAKVYKTILEKFLKSSEIDKLLNQYYNGDLEEARKTVHTIKGMTGNLSFTALYQSSVELEAKMKTGEAKDRDVDKLKALWEKTKVYAKLVADSID